MMKVLLVAELHIIVSSLYFREDVDGFDSKNPKSNFNIIFNAISKYFLFKLVINFKILLSGD